MQLLCHKKCLSTIILTTALVGNAVLKQNKIMGKSSQHSELSAKVGLHPPHAFKALQWNKFLKFEFVPCCKAHQSNFCGFFLPLQ